MKNVKLAQLCQMQSGGTPRRGESKYYGGEIPWAKISDLEMSGDGLVHKTEETITVAGLKSINGRLFPKGTLLLAMYGSVGKTAIANIELSTNQAILGIQIRDKNSLDLKYLKHWLFFAKEGIINRARGAALQNISLSIVKELKIPLPPLAEQIHIAQVLDQADRLRQQDRQLLAHYDQLVQAVFMDMFGDPVRNEKGWETVLFSDVGKLDRGVSKHRPRNAPELLGGNHPLIQTGDVARSGGYITKYKSTYSDIGLKQSKLWKKGTLCITIAANIANTGILTFDACFPDSVVGFAPNEKATTEYVQHWLSFLQEALEAAAPMSAQKNINLEILRALPIPLPPIELQQKFVEIKAQIEAQKAATQQLQAQSEALFNSLLQQAFRGELTRPEPAAGAAAGQLALALE